MQLVNYEYYNSQYQGRSISASVFGKYGKLASKKVNYYTYNRICDSDIDDDIRDVTCEVAELLFEQENLKEKITNSNEKEISSDTLGPRSTSYANKSNLQEKQILSDEQLEQKIYLIIYQALAHKGLMRRTCYD